MGIYTGQIPMLVGGLQAYINTAPINALYINYETQTNDIAAAYDIILNSYQGILADESTTLITDEEIKSKQKIVAMPDGSKSGLVLWAGSGGIAKSSENAVALGYSTAYIMDASGNLTTLDLSVETSPDTPPSSVLVQDLAIITSYGYMDTTNPISYERGYTIEESIDNLRHAVQHIPDEYFDDKWVTVKHAMISPLVYNASGNPPIEEMRFYTSSIVPEFKTIYIAFDGPADEVIDHDRGYCVRNNDLVITLPNATSYMVIMSSSIPGISSGKYKWKNAVYKWEPGTLRLIRISETDASGNYPVLQLDKSPFMPTSLPFYCRIGGLGYAPAYDGDVIYWAMGANESALNSLVQLLQYATTNDIYTTTSSTMLLFLGKENTYYTGDYAYVYQYRDLYIDLFSNLYNQARVGMGAWAWNASENKYIPLYCNTGISGLFVGGYDYADDCPKTCWDDCHYNSIMAPTVETLQSGEVDYVEISPGYKVYTMVYDPENNASAYVKLNDEDVWWASGHNNYSTIVQPIRVLILNEEPDFDLTEEDYIKFILSHAQQTIFSPNVQFDIQTASEIAKMYNDNIPFHEYMPGGKYQAIFTSSGGGGYYD